jgi:hypothetical protein
VIKWQVRRGLLRLHARAAELFEAVKEPEGAAVLNYVEHLDLDGPMDSVLNVLNHPLNLLTSLDLSNKGMGDPNVSRLCRHPRLERLTRLNLQHNTIDNAGAHALYATLHLGRLTLLDLRNNRISGTIINDLSRRFGPALRL